MASDSRWDSRFDSRLAHLSIEQSALSSLGWPKSNSDASHAAQGHRLSDLSEEDPNFGNILIAASSLPQVQRHNLIPDKTIGVGSSFRVNREIVTKTDFSAHFVAVKHVLVRNRSPTNLRQVYRAVLREARVLTHPPLRGHTGIVRAIAYGWTDNASHNWDPYFVLEYSDYGTLTAFVQKIRPSLDERLDLVRDVAEGLEALHNNRFIHGDIKPQNVLVFDTQDDTTDRIPQIAKLADFGCAVSEEEILEGEYRPLGTAKYNAPEIESLAPRLSKYKSNMFQLLAKSDVYSFGLVVWEVAKNGQSYLETGWLRPGETPLELKQRIHDSREGGLHARAMEYCETLRTTATLEVHTALGLLQEAMKMSLKDNPQGRSTMADLVRHLNQTLPERRQSHSNRTQMIAISDSNLMLQERLNKLYRAPIDDRVRSGLRGLKNTWEYPRPQISPEVMEHPQKSSEWIVTHRRGMLTLPPPKAFFRKSFNFLKTSMAALSRPPLNIQTLVFKEIQSRAHISKDASERGAAFLQLSICYHLGFGVNQDDKQSILYLHEASHTSKVAGAIVVPVSEAIVNEDFPEHEEPNRPQDQRIADEGLVRCSSTSFNEPFHARVQIFQQRAGNEVAQVVRNKQDPFTASALRSMSDFIRDQVAYDNLFRVLLTEPGNLLEKYFEIDTYIPTEALSAALTTICRFGNFEGAMALIPHLRSFKAKPGEPNPLHWLISFNSDEAVILARLLIQGSPNAELTKGICASLIDDFNDESTFFPEHCMELFGTPLHWAVRTQNLLLVQEFVKLGARIDSVAMSMTVVDEVPLQAEYSPLDLAVIFHMPEMVRYLLGCNVTLYSARSGTSQILLNLLGVETQPFARYIIHGKSHRDAVEETLQSLIDAGFAINSRDADGETPLSRALFQTGPERYILEALLKKGAWVDDAKSADGQTMASRIILACAARPNDAWKLSLILPYVKDLNQRDDSGRNALHYCAATGNLSMTEILLETGRVDIDAQDSKGLTAVALSALFGRVAVLEFLLHNKAKRDQPDLSGTIPFEWAIRSRKLEAIGTFIRSGSELCFQKGGRASLKTTVLHEAIMGMSEGSRTSIVKQILDGHPTLQTSSCLDARDEAMLTPLQTAAYRGDVSAVKALIAAGADRTITNDNRNGYRVPEHVRRRLGFMVPAPLSLDYLGTALQIVSSFTAYFDNLGPPLFLTLPDWDWLKVGGELAIREYRSALQEIKILLSRR